MGGFTDIGEAWKLFIHKEWVEDGKSDAELKEKLQHYIYNSRKAPKPKAIKTPPVAMGLNDLDNVMSIEGHVSTIPPSLGELPGNVEIEDWKMTGASHSQGTLSLVMLMYPTAPPVRMI